jgi:lipoate-protein ligase A
VEPAAADTTSSVRVFGRTMASRRAPALLLRLRNVPIFHQLKLEEALFRADSRSWLITNEWSADGGPCTLSGVERPAADAIAIVLGISGKPAELVHLDRAAEARVPLIKRFSGGGTVIMDTNTLFVTFIAAADALEDVRPYPEPILEWTSEVYADALRDCGVDGFATHANDYCIHDRKFGGNAQSISGKRWLHHTSLLWDYEPARMALLQMPSKRPAYRADRPHGDFIRGLAASGATDRSQLLDAIVSAAAERFELSEVGIEAAEAALSAPHRKVTTLLDLAAA